MEATVISMTEVAPSAQPRFSGMSHVSLPCLCRRDIAFKGKGRF